MDLLLTILAIFSGILGTLMSVFAALLVAERALLLRRGPVFQHKCPIGLDADLIELKAYTHGSIHELRDKVHTVQLGLETRSAGLTERLARLEAKVDAYAASNTETLTRMLKLIEDQAIKQEMKPC